MELLRGFEDLGKGDLILAGGKGANLGEMARAGLPVPPGFVLLTPAYQLFVAQNGLQAEIERLATRAASADSREAEAASQAIRSLFDQGTMPDVVAEAVRAAYARLGGGVVAVRSSATAEDLPGASFAGQQESYLGLEGEEQVLAAVRSCWSSLWTARAISYRARQGISPAAVALAVVIQRQAQALAAGVLFTANPVNGRRDQMTVDGAWGLGESVVSGQVTPDSWVVDGATGAVLEERLACKQVMTVRQSADRQGTETVAVPPELQFRPVLDAGQIAALAGLGRQTAAHFGSPQDIEWVLGEDGAFCLVQSRPITALFPLAAPEPLPEEGLRVYLCLNSAQGFLEPFTPMGMEFFRHFGRGFAALWGFRLPPDQPAPALKAAAGRLYLDATYGLRNRRIRPLILGMSHWLDQLMSEILTGLLAREPQLGVVAGSRGLRPPIGLVLRGLGRVIFGVAAPDAGRRSVHARLEAHIAGLEAEAASLSDMAARQRFLREMPGRLFPTMVPILGAAVVPGLAARFLAQSKVKQWLGEEAGFERVLRSLPHNPTTEMDLALWRLSRELKAEGAEPSANHPGVKAFLARYGHRAVREIDMGMPRWAEEPTQVLEVLRTYLGHGPEADAEAHFGEGAVEAEAAGAELVRQVRQRKGYLRSVLLGFLLRRARGLAGLREMPKFHAVRAIALCRRVLLAAGADLVAAGRLDEAQEIFYLELDDLTSNEDLRAKAAANRAEYQRELGRRAVPRVMTSLGEVFYAPQPSVAGALAGIAVSPGVCEGRVRVVFDPKSASLEPGEVLVAPGTDPAWTPLFLSAGALVMETGGPMSHGSTVAREYGIPAVVGVAGATERLHTGQRVRVDGESGQVIPLDEAGN